MLRRIRHYCAMPTCLVRLFCGKEPTEGAVAGGELPSVRQPVYAIDRPQHIIEMRERRKKKPGDVASSAAIAKTCTGCFAT